MDIKKIISKSKHFETNILEYEKGELVIKDNLDPVKINGSIDWDYRHPQNSRTYQVYLHSLNIVKDFVQMYLKTDDKNYIKEARKIINDWYNKNSDYKINNFAWNEHAASYRVNNIIYFQEHSEKTKLPQKIFNEIITKHVDFLNDDQNYRDNNHGIMMDNSLLVASFYLENKEKQELITSKVYYRLNYSIKRDFSYKGLHLENSPEYHRLVLTLLNRSKRILKELNKPFPSDVLDILENAKRITSIFIKPNRQYPLVGDTGTIIDKKIPKKFVDFIDYEAGLSIFNNKNNDKISDSTWFLFKSGYQSKTHKHKDDLSMNLYMDGMDIFIDSGKYNYEKENPIREKVVSPEGHSTIYIEGKDYKLTSPQKDQLKLSLNKYIKKHKYKLVSAKNNMYHATYLSRTCILTDSDELIVYDSINSKINQKYIQNFVLNPNAKVSKINNRTFRIMINDKKYCLQLIDDNNEKVNADIKETVVSFEFGKTVKTTQLQFSKQGTRTSFLTAFYREGHSDNISNLRIDKSQIMFSDKGKKHIINL